MSNKVGTRSETLCRLNQLATRAILPDINRNRYFPIPPLSFLQVTLTSVASDARGNLRVRISRGNVLALELGQEASVSLVEGTRVTEAVDLAVTAEVRRALSVGVGVGRSKELAVNGVLDGGGDVLEDVTLSEDVAALTDLEGVAGVVVPVVVDLLTLVKMRIYWGTVYCWDIQRATKCCSEPWGNGRWCDRCSCP